MLLIRLHLHLAGMLEQPKNIIFHLTCTGSKICLKVTLFSIYSIWMKFQRFRTGGSICRRKWVKTIKKIIRKRISLLEFNTEHWNFISQDWTNLDLDASNRPTILFCVPFQAWRQSFEGKTISYSFDEDITDRMKITALTVSFQC